MWSIIGAKKQLWGSFETKCGKHVASKFYLAASCAIPRRCASQSTGATCQTTVLRELVTRCSALVLLAICLMKSWALVINPKVCWASKGFAYSFNPCLVMSSFPGLKSVDNPKLPATTGKARGSSWMYSCGATSEVFRFFFW